MTARPATILVVVEDPTTRESTSRVLRSAGFDVLEAATGERGLELANSEPDLVILGVKLPDMSGYEVCRRLRHAEPTATMPIVHLSSSVVRDVERVHGLELGADGYLPHPVEPLVLIATVNAFLRARRAEEGRRRSEQNFEAIFDHAPHGIALLDADLRFLEVNPAFCIILGRARDELVGLPLHAFRPAALDADEARMRRSLDVVSAWRGLLPLVNAAGDLVYLEWSISPHSLPNIRVAIVTDVTEKRRIESDREQLLLSERAARAASERANQLKDEFLATLSHELRTPLNVIVGWSEILNRADRSVDPAEGLEIIARNARIQQQLIADLLDISRITSGKLRLDVEPLDVAAVAESVLNAVAPAAEVKGIPIGRRLHRDAGRVMGDPARLHQIIWNLVNNAVKFTPRGGRVEVTVEAADGSVQLTVTDTGQGISPDFIPFLFDRFRQEDAHVSRRFGGLGLGLAIVKHLTELHGGTVTAESAGDGRGATFRVRLPLVAAESPSNEPAPPPAVRSSPDLLRGKTVLLVDDDTDGRQLVRRLLTDAGASVVEAECADDALLVLDRETPDLLISDIGMPRSDGYALIRRVRERHSAKELPAIALTAFARSIDRQRAMTAGYQMHLTKPVDSTRLLSAASTLRSVRT